jgi:hypothetical protein
MDLVNRVCYIKLYYKINVFVQVDIQDKKGNVLLLVVQ